MVVVTVNNLMLQVELESSNREDIVIEVTKIIDKINLYLNVVEAPGTPMLSDCIEVKDITVEKEKYGDH